MRVMTSISKARRVAIVFLGRARRQAMNLRAGWRSPSSACRRSSAASSLPHRRRGGADREARQDRLARLRAERAALGDLDRGGQRFRNVGEQHRHFGAGLEAVIGRQLLAIGLGDQACRRRCTAARHGLRNRRRWRNTARWSRPAAGPWHRRDRSGRLRRGAPSRCRGAAIRHRAGRRTGWPAGRSASPRAPHDRPAAPARSARPARRSARSGPRRRPPAIRT